MLTESRLKVTIVDQQNHAHTFEVAEGDNLLDIAQANELEMEGACGGSCACSTCHVIVGDQDYYDKMEEPEDDENDSDEAAKEEAEEEEDACRQQAAHKAAVSASSSAVNRAAVTGRCGRPTGPLMRR